MSSLLTTTMPQMKETILALTVVGLSGSVKVMIGGAPVTEEYTMQIEADGYALEKEARTSPWKDGATGGTNAFLQMKRGGQTMIASSPGRKCACTTPRCPRTGISAGRIGPLPRYNISNQDNISAYVLKKQGEVGVLAALCTTPPHHREF
jgi:hypothetical protein